MTNTNLNVYSNTSQSISKVTNPAIVPNNSNTSAPNSHVSLNTCVSTKIANKSPELGTIDLSMMFNNGNSHIETMLKQQDRILNVVENLGKRNADLTAIIKNMVNQMILETFLSQRVLGNCL